MAEVSGTITGANGIEDVILNNAATEATLVQLLAATASAGRLTTSLLKDLATKSGLSTDKFADTSEQIDGLGASAGSATKGVGELDSANRKLKNTYDNIADITAKLIAGNGSFGDLLKIIRQVPTGFSVVAGSLASLAIMQEQSFQAYQKISNSGASFSGSLTDMRLAAANSYLSLNEFTSLIKDNSSTLANMGGTVTEGTRAFALLSKEFVSGSFGRNALALGYSFDQINSSLLSYISITGGRSAEEMRNTRQLSEGTAMYLEELDRISALTGKDRKAKEDEIKKAAANPAWELFMARLRQSDPEAANRMMLGFQQASRFGEDGMRAFQEQAVGLATDPEAAKLYALYPELRSQFQGMIDTSRDHSISTKQAQRIIDQSGADAQFASGKQVEMMGIVGDAQSMYGGKFAKQFAIGQSALTENINKNINSAKDREDFENRVYAEQKARQSGQAKDAASLDQAFKSVSASLLEFVTPIVRLLTPVLNSFARLLAGVINFLDKWVVIIPVISVALAVLATRMSVAAAKMAISSITDLLDKTKDITGTRVFVTNWPVNLGGSGLSIPEPNGTKPTTPGEKAPPKSTTRAGGMLAAGTSFLKGWWPIIIATGASFLANQTENKKLAATADTLSSTMMGLNMGQFAGGAIGGLLGAAGGPAGIAAGALLGSRIGMGIGGLAGAGVGISNNLDRFDSASSGIVAPKSDSKQTELASMEQKIEAEKKQYAHLEELRAQTTSLDKNNELQEQIAASLKAIKENTNAYNNKWLSTVK